MVEMRLGSAERIEFSARESRINVSVRQMHFGENKWMTYHTNPTETEALTRVPQTINCCARDDLRVKLN